MIIDDFFCKVLGVVHYHNLLFYKAIRIKERHIY
jgi:hypothetical protein